MKNKRKKGFTLIELIATMAIFTILVAVTFSLITTVLKYNSINKTTFDANANSRAFFEIIRNNRHDSATRPYPSDGKWCYFYFDDKSELESFIKNQFIENVDNSTTDSYYMFNDKKTSFTEIENQNRLNKRYCIEVKVDKKDPANLATPPDLKGVVQLTTRSWDMQKGEISLIARKYLIAIN